MTTTTKSRAAAAKVAEEARQGKSNIAGMINLSEARQVTGLFFPNFGNGNYRVYLGTLQHRYLAHFIAGSLRRASAERGLEDQGEPVEDNGGSTSVRSVGSS
jgi:hypothetical protein